MFEAKIKKCPTEPARQVTGFDKKAYDGGWPRVRTRKIEMPSDVRKRITEPILKSLEKEYEFINVTDTGDEVLITAENL